MPTFSKPPAYVLQELEDVMAKYHPGLRDAGVRVDVLLQLATRDDNGDPTGPAIKHGGYTAAAVVRIVGLKDRVKGMGDAEILLDGDRYDEWDERELAAILDHELTHLEFRTDKVTGNVKRDDAGRPQLKMRLHDHQYGWFESVARRHGKFAVEVQQAEKLVSDENWRQLFLPGFDGQESLKQELARAFHDRGILAETA